MRLIRYGKAGSERPGLMDAHGVLRDLSHVVPDIGPAQLGPDALAQLARLDTDSLDAVSGHPRLGCPVAGIGKCIGIGLNYTDHAQETGSPIPTEPIIFTKAISAIQGPDDDIMLPQGSVKTDWEVELGIVIGSRASYVAEGNALDHVAGFVLANDVSEREYQMERGGTWDKGKGCDTFGPIGPWLVTQDEIADPNNLDLWLDVNGQRMQTGNTSKMIFNVKEIVSYVSRFMTLMPGDVIITGTPPGVGLGQKPPRFLKAGDVVTLGGQGLGTQKQRVVGWRAL
ncbi:MAG: fumarylacetoacetate hydrolase family protein [Burkholderiaceae bacterium]|nr:fumarylacetoacetate hydrolase family protein [Burkholderiaceae bacterium]MCD8516181.1 fumarylacetoacetate hydrolase family protein [Burkholderiaceae bacterium]MCD8536712.1 fumarylacetoacetate hydrolase family protein [Burkholderiaceae bacterium]MCD8566189.1 fumarylacetoacetate hydrolase family protein [Burkholderiaceae bacterium]